LVGEAVNLKRDVLFVIIGLVIFGIIIYILLQFMFFFVLFKSVIGDFWDQVGDGFYMIMIGFFVEIVMLLSIGWLVDLLVFLEVF